MEELIAMLIVSASVFYIAYPVIVKNTSEKNRKRKNNRKKSSTNGHLSQLQSKKAQIYDSIKDLDMDFETGKISQTDYEEMKTNYKTEAIEILKTIDSERGMNNGSKSNHKSSRSTKQAQKQVEIYCPECGSQNLESYKFCMNCGNRLINPHE